MPKLVINRKYTLQRLQDNGLWQTLKNDMDKYNAFKHELKKVFMEKTEDAERDAIMVASPYKQHLNMLFFLDALSTRDYNTMKFLLPRMFEIGENLHSIYLEVLRSRFKILSQNNDLFTLNRALQDCQKDLLNLNSYETEDVWLFVMLVCLKPLSTCCLLSNNGWYLSYKLDELTCDMDNASEFQAYKNECQAVQTKISSLAADVSPRKCIIDLHKK